MTGFLRALDAWPRPLRWAMFLPVGIVAALIVDTVLANVFYALGLRTVGAGTEGVTKAALQSFAFGLTLTFVAAVLSPRPWVIGLVMFAVGLLFRVTPVVSMMMVPYQRERLPSLAVPFAIIIGAHVLGGGLGLYLIRHVTAPRHETAESEGA